MAEHAELKIDSAKALKMLSDLTERAKKTTEGDQKYLNLLSIVAFRDVNEHFQQEEGPDGAWTAWSDVYADRISKRKNPPPPTKILKDSGNLRQNNMPGNVRNTSQGILFFNPAKTKSDFPYAYAHDEGGPILPKRSFMWLSASALEDMAEQTLKFVTES